jgi:hypothetical protein
VDGCRCGGVVQSEAQETADCDGREWGKWGIRTS